MVTGESGSPYSLKNPVNTGLGFVAITSQVHSDTGTAAAISPPAALCMLLDVLLLLVTGFPGYI
jgi:hypothetical protein